MLAPVTEGGVPAGADPAPAAVVALVLLGQRLEVAAHQLVGVELFEGGPLLVGQPVEVLGIREPLHQLVAHRELPLDAVEHLGEDAIEGVEVGLALDEQRLREVVEGQQVAAVQALLEGRHQHLPLLDGDGDAFFAQSVEEIEEHGPLRTRARAYSRAY